MTNSTASTQIHLRAAGVSLVLDTPPNALPSILHWGADLGDLSDDDLQGVAATVSPLLENAVDVPVRVSMIPEHSAGWLGAPGLQGSRAGSDWSPRFDDVRYERAGSGVTAVATDAVAKLELNLEIELTASGVVRTRATLTNRSDSAFELQRLVVTLPVPPVATESLDQAGRWAKERVPQRRAITVGTHLRESRRGRTGADAATVLVAGESGFGFGPATGEVWGMHVGFSGNHVSYLERMTSGRTLLGGGELLLPGEVSLGLDEAYATPWIYGSWGRGLDEQAARFHEWLRARPQHPRSVRPVTLNVWEAVYFDHRLEPLLELAEQAAAAGVERYVLDDGWFAGRRSDDAGLGDWVVDTEVWPQGLRPLVDRVRELGMQFGLWFEPEMVNPDSDLARAHPEWILQAGGRMPLEQRKQQVLNLAIDDAYAYILESVSSLVDEYRLDYLKWDHNRDLVDAGSTVTGKAGVSAQTHAVYRLFAELKARHPHLEIESCSSGGARVDFGVLEYTDRVWASDCIDPLERQGILRWTGQLVPPELVGSHIGSPHSHTTGRTHDLSFRASTAMFGHFGVEWNISRASEAERAELAEWIELHKQFRALIHSGRTVRVDHPITELAVHGIVAQDRAGALFEFALLGRPSTWPPGLVRIPGLDPERRYRVSSVGPHAPFSTNNTAPSWQIGGGVVLSGRVLAAVGIQAPPLQPEHSALVRILAV